MSARPLRRPRRAAAAALLVGVLAACGTTVPLTTEVTAAGADALSGGAAATETLGDAPAPGDAGTDSRDGTDLAVGTGTAPGAVAGGRGPTGTTAGAPPTSAGAAPAPRTGSGPTSPAGGVAVGAAGPKKPVKIGFVLAPDANEFFATFGSSAETGDQRALLKSVVEWANANGGLAGHPIDPVVETVSLTSQETYAQQYQKLCTAFTQDAKVLAAAMVGIGADTNMDRCMNAARTLFVTGSRTLHDEQDYARTPFVVSPSEVSASTLARTLATLIVQGGYEKRGGTVGLLNYDIPAYDRAVERHIKPVLAAAGIKLVQYTIPPPASTAAIGGSVSVVQNAQLRMAAEGVKTVTFLCAGCVGFFQQNAASQNYYPRYVLSSLDGLVGRGGSGNARAMRSAVAVGWEPVQDVPAFRDRAARAAANPTFKACLDITKGTGQVSNDVSLTVAAFLCDEVMSLRAAALANPAEPISATTLRDGLRALKSTHVSALSHATLLTPARHAGASSYRLLQWDEGAAQLTYRGPLRRFADAS